MEAAKSAEVGSQIFPFAATESSTLSDIYGINEMKLKDVLDEQEHLMLFLRQKEGRWKAFAEEVHGECGRQ